MPTFRTLALSLAMAGFASLAAAAGTTFDTPEAAVTALVAALKADDLAALRGIFGPQGGKLVSSGDPVADDRSRDTFVAAYAEASKIVPEGDSRAVLEIGKDAWPMPIPLLKSAAGRWSFDTAAGEKEILARRIGRNELSAIQVCLAIADAEREYAAQDPDKDGVPQYAARFVSSPGRRDGLYWKAAEGEAKSPLGSLLAAASVEGYAQAGPRTLAPYHGYTYRLLTRQGKDAKGGAYDYVVRGHMIGGFALVATPARYGASGIMTFIVNHDGEVYQKDLGRNTAAAAAAIKAYNPDAGWKKP
jgi:hypothetical protein